MTTVTDEYDQQATDFLNAANIEFTAKFLRNGKYFPDDKETRDVWQITLERKGARAGYVFEFGQSIVNSGKKPKVAPRPYDVLSCLTKSDPGTFEEFCSEYGYNEDSRKAYSVWEAVTDEWKNVKGLFTQTELEQLHEIN